MVSAAAPRHKLFAGTLRSLENISIGNLIFC